MPGSIQVSVLGFKELPFSPNSIKVSLSKVEHEVGENETYSFPLTNLRDNLIITVQDSEGNQVSQSGVRTMLIIEKGTWDDVFSIEGGGLIHMKLEFFLSDEERNRIRLMREFAMKKKQAEILGSRHELYEGALKETISNDVKETNEEITSNKDNAILQRQADVPERLQEYAHTRDFLKNNNTVTSEPLYNLDQKLDRQILEGKNPNFVKKMGKGSKFPHLSKETEVNTTKNNEIQLQETELLKRLKDSSSSDVGSSRLTVAEKIKSFSPKLAGEMDRQGSLEKTPRNIKKMISVFESTLSQDRVPLKPVSTKSYRFGTSRLLKDYYEKSESSLNNSEKSSSSRLRNSFSTGDLRKNFSDIITKGDQVEFDNNLVEPSENMHSKGNDPLGAEEMGKNPLNNQENLPKSRHEAQGDEEISLSGDWKIEEKGHQEKNVASIPEFVGKGEAKESPESADPEASNGSFGQVMKVVLVVGFGVLVFFFRRRESGQGKKKKNIRTIRNPNRL